MQDESRILDAAARGEVVPADELWPVVYDELRRLAAKTLSHERPGHTLDATGLVHEAYLRLVGSGSPQDWNGRGHFYAAAAEAMRRILIERARRYQTVKHGGGREHVELRDDLIAVDSPDDDVLAIDEALQALAREDPQTAELVKLRFFAGLPLEEAANVLGISERTAYRNWSYARAWLYRHLNGEEKCPPA